MKQALSKLFHTRWFAVALCVAGVVFSTLLNTRVGLGRKSDEVITRFYKGAEGESCIAAQLGQLSEAATGLAAIAGHYSLDSSAATLAAERLEQGLQTADGRVGALHADYKTLLAAADELSARLEKAQMSKRDAENLALYTASAADAQSAIEADDYNVRAASFLTYCDEFPTGGLAAFAGVQLPELFR